VFDERGALALSYRLLRCWVSEYQALPDLDSASNTVAIETIKLEIEGWEIEPSAAPPAGA
jgi:phage tail-like protein